MEHNRLNEQKEKAPQVGQIRGAAHNQRWTDLLADFAGLNQIKPSAEFTLDALKRNLRSGGSWGKTYQWPGCDHPSFYKRNQRAVLMDLRSWRRPVCLALCSCTISASVPLLPSFDFGRLSSIGPPFTAI